MWEINVITDKGKFFSSHSHQSENGNQFLTTHMSTEHSNIKWHFQTNKSEEINFVWDLSLSHQNIPTRSVGGRLS